MNVKKRYILVALLALFSILGTACSGSNGATATRTPRAVAEKGDATQTPWIIYVPVTTTPDPFTVTPLPTVTSSQPQPPTAQPAQPTRTKAPATAKPAAAKPTATPASPPTAGPPSPTAAPACGPYTVATLGPLPENGVTRTTKENPGGGMAIVFQFTPAVSYPLDSKIGYRVDIKGKSNNTSRYISHNDFLNTKEVVLDQYAVYNLTLPNHDDTNLSWTVTPVMASGGFDNNGGVIGTVTTCGPATGPWSIFLHVQ